MESETYTKIPKLTGCSFLPGSFEKRFVRQLSSLSPLATLTEKQLMLLGQIFYRYRKQLPPG